MKLTLSDLTSLTNESSATAAINANGTLIEAALENTLSLDGTIPNHMSADLDLNGNRILNLPNALTDQEPITLGQLEDLIDTAALAPINASYLTLGTNSSLTSERVLTAGTGVSFTDGGAGSTLTINNTAVPASAALTKTDDTNVTLTLGGTPTTALLQATSLTLGWTGTLSAARGGFGTSVSASSGVPLFTTGTPTFTSTTGSGNFVRATSPTFVTPLLDTPTSGVLTNCTGYTIANVTGLGTGVATFLATPSSANLLSAVTDETGTGSLVFGTSPGFTTAANPVSSGGAALGTTALPWSNLFLASGGVINFNNGDVTATHSSNKLAFAGAASGYTFDAPIVIGNTSTVTMGAVTAALEVVGATSSADSTLAIGRYINAATGPLFRLFHSRNGTIGSFTIVQADDSLGTMAWAGASSGSGDLDAAAIRCFVDGTPGATAMPGRIVFVTTPTGAGGTLTDRVKIDNAGVMSMLSNKFVTLASSTAAASLSIPSGTAPTSPVSGDFWYDGTNLKFRDGVTTRTLTWT